MDTVVVERASSTGNGPTHFERRKLDDDGTSTNTKSMTKKNSVSGFLVVQHCHLFF